MSPEDIRTRLRAEFLEMPGMRLSARQVQRLCGVEADVCQAALDSLVDANFLAVRADGRYALPGESPARLPAQIW